MALPYSANMTEAVSTGFTWFGSGIDVLMSEPFIYFLGLLVVGFVIVMGIEGIKKMAN